MPPTGSTQASLYALGGVARGGVTRGGGLSARVFCYVDDVLRDISDLTIFLRAGSGANTATFVARGWEPTPGQIVIITQGSKNRIRRLFGGQILSLDEANVTSDPDNRHVTANLVDWSWSLNADLVMGYFTGTADEIAIELMARFAPAAFTTRKVESGLDTVAGGIQFTDVYLSVALERLARRAGAIQFIDHQKDLYFRVTPHPAITNPVALTRSLSTLKSFAIKRDYSQVVTRVYFEGGGSVALTEVDAGEDILPVLDASWYPSTGGLVKSGTQRFPYTGVDLGGGGSLVGPGAAPLNAPTLALAAGSGVTTGAHDITLVYVTPSGRSLPSPVGSITVGTVSAPSAAPTAGTPSNGAGLNAGSHRYYAVFRTAAGRTTAGPVSNAVTAVAQQADPGSGELPTPVNSSTFSGGLLNTKRYFWKLAMRRTSDGAVTLPTPSVQLVCDLDNRSAKFDLTGTSTPSGYERVYYRTEGVDSFTVFTDAGLTYKEVSGTISGGFFYDTTAEASRTNTVPSANNTAKGTCAVTGIPVSGDALVTHVDLYREFNSAGAATAKLAFSVTNGTTSASDSTANASLGATVPSSNTAAAGQISVTDIGIGPGATTERELYMSPAGGGDRKRALTIANNTATTGTITMSDATLASQLAEPSTDTSGLSQPSGQVLPGATSCVVSGTAPFRSTGGWALTGTQVFRYAAFSGSSLTGIPASGVGAIAQPIAYNATVAAAPQLTGISSGSPDLGSITYTIPKGQDVNVVAQVDDVDAQTALAAIIGGSGVKAVALQNRAISFSEARARAVAYLARRSLVTPTSLHTTKDVNAVPNTSQVITLAAPTSVNETLTVQSVTIRNFQMTPPLDATLARHADYMPDRQVEASTELLSIEDLLRQDRVK